MTVNFEVAGRSVGPNSRCFVIAEVAQSHDGSIGLAHAFIDAIADAGADAVKFQTHIAEAESTLDEQFRVEFSRQDPSRYEYWKRMEFPPEQWQNLSDHAASRDLVFLSSPSSIAAVDLLERIGMPAWKIGSGEFRSHGLIERIIATRRPILLSTGMSSWEEIEAAATRIRNRGANFALFQCTSGYPTPLELVGLNVMSEIKRRFRCPVGLSDHSGQPWPSLAAIACGAHLVEVHVIFDRRMFGPDVTSSLTFEELANVTAMRDACAVMFNSPVNKDAVAASMSEMRAKFAKSLAPVRPLAAGTTLTFEMLAAKKPGTGIPPTESGRLVGRVLAHDVVPERLLQWSDIVGGVNA